MKYAFLCLLLLLGCESEAQRKAWKKQREHEAFENQIAHARGCKKQCDAAGTVVAKFEFDMYGIVECICGTRGAQVPSAPTQQDDNPGVVTGVIVNEALKPSPRR